MSHVAHYLVKLRVGPALTTLETLLAEPAELSYRELKAAADHERDVANALDEMERRGAVDRSGEDLFWPTRACRRFHELLGCGCAAATEDDEA
jgi:hypothetical protein